MAELQAHDADRAGESIEVDINLRSAVLFDPSTGKAFTRLAAMREAARGAGPSRKGCKFCWPPTP